MIRYTLTPGTRYAEKTGRTFDAEEIRVDGELVGAMWSGAADFAERDENGEWPAEVAPIVELARSRGCEYILFARDSDPIEELPTFDR